jgi:hypothetical protein
MTSKDKRGGGGSAQEDVRRRSSGLGWSQGYVIGFSPKIQLRASLLYGFSIEDLQNEPDSISNSFDSIGNLILLGFNQDSRLGINSLRFSS